MRLTCRTQRPPVVCPQACAQIAPANMGECAPANGPLRALHRTAQSRHGELDREDLARRLRNLVKQARRMESLVNTLLDVSNPTRSDPRDQRWRESGSDRDRSRGVRTIQTRAVRVGAAITLRQGGPVIGEWDRLRIEQVIGNLISNAIKYAPRSSIEIDVGERGNLATLTVRDHGPGIANPGDCCAGHQRRLICHAPRG